MSDIVARARSRRSAGSAGASIGAAGAMRCSSLPYPGCSVRHCWSARCSRHLAEPAGVRPVRRHGASSAATTSRACSATRSSCARCATRSISCCSPCRPWRDRPCAGAGAQPPGPRAAPCCAAIFFASSVLSVTIVTLIWRMVLHARARADRRGAARLFGLPPPAFITDAGAGPAGGGDHHVWWCIGLPMMLFLAALQQIPRRNLRGGGAGQRQPLAHAAGRSPCRRSAAPSSWWSIIEIVAAVPAVRPGAADDPGRPEQRVAADRAVHLRDRLPALAARLRRGRLAGAVRCSC